MKKKLTVRQMEVRDEKIVRMYRSGKYSIRSLAEKVGLGKSRVHEIVRYYLPSYF
jgi:hypothetical protein